MSAVFEIPEGNYTRLAEKFASLVRKARKLGSIEPPQLATIWEADIPTSEAGKVQHFYYVKVTGEPPAVSGYTLCAKLDHTSDSEIGLLIRGVPNAPAVPVEYRKAQPVCDHCGYSRRRNSTYVLRNDADGSFIQVGRNCLADFLGGRSPEEMVAWAELAVALEDSLEGSQGSDGGEYRYNRETVMAVTAKVTRLVGWCSRREAQDSYDKTATADIVGRLLIARKADMTDEELDMLYPDEQDTKLASEAIAWIESQRDTAAEGENDYMYNLTVVLTNHVLRHSWLGLACSGINAYRRHLEQEIKRAYTRQAAAVSQHIGTVKGRLETTATVEMVREIDGAYGVSTMYRLRDEAGNVLVWFSSGSFNLDQGVTYKLKGTVKAHDEYQGVKQTMLTRCKVLSTL